MPIETIIDDSGVGMKLQRTSKNRFTGVTFSMEAVENMHKVKLRDDDVFICSYSKCGVHWLWENVRILLTGEIKKDQIQKECSMMEYVENLEDIPSPRILNNHGFFDEQPKGLFQGKGKLILLYRNPKDVAVSSYFHHTRFSDLEYNGSMDNFLQRFIDGKVFNSSYFEYLKSFYEGLSSFKETNEKLNCEHSVPNKKLTMMDNVLLVRYEDLHSDPMGERRRISGFLGKPDYDDEFLREVCSATGIEVMREAKKDVTPKDADGEIIMYRKGKVGGWKRQLTVSQNRWFNCKMDTMWGQPWSSMFVFVYE